MARRGLSKTLVVSVVVSAMVVLVVGSIGLMKLWQRRDPAIYAQQATDACRARDMFEAVRAYARAYRETLDPLWIVESGLVAKEFGDAVRALNLFDKAVAARSSFLPAHRNRLGLRLELVRLEPSAEGYANLRKDAEALLALRPKDPRALLARSIALAGLVDEDPAYAEESLTAVKRAHELAPKDVEIADTLARRLERQDPNTLKRSAAGGRGLSPAEEVYRRLVQAVPDSEQARLRYAQFLIRRLRRRQADAAGRGIPLGVRQIRRELEDIRRLLDRTGQTDSQNAEAALGWADYWSLAGEPDKAIEVLSKATQTAPNDLRVYVELGRRMLEAGRASEARTILQRGLDRPFDRDSYRGLLDRPRRHRLWCMMGWSYLQEHQPGSPGAAALVARADEARRNAELELSPDHWLGRTLLGGVRQAQGRLLAAVACYQEADRMLDWRKNPADKLGLNLALVELHTRLEQYGPAQEAVAAVLRHRPGQPVALAERAWIGLRLGRARNAAIDAGRALRGLLETPTATAPHRFTVGRAGRADLVRRTRRVLWVACRLEKRSADASRAARDLSPLTAEDRMFWAEMSYRYGLARRSEPLLKQAEQAYLAAVRDDPTRVDAVRRLAELHAIADRRGDTLRVIQTALGALKGRAAPATARARLRALQIELDPKTPADRRGPQIVAVLSTVKDPVRRAELLAAYYLANDQAAQAVRQLNTVASARPDDVGVLERQFAAALAAGDFSTAEAVGMRAGELNADAAGGRLYEGRRLLARGLALQAEAREKRDTDPAGAHAADEHATSLLGEALDALRAGAEEAPGLSMARVWLGRVLHALGRGEARDSYRMALVLNPLNAEAHRELARLGKAEPAREIDVARHLQEAIRLSAKGLDGLPADPWLHARAQDIYERNHPAESIRRREALRKAKPRDVDNLLRLGLLYRRVGKKDQAGQCFEQAVKVAPKDIELHGRVSAVYRLDKRFDDATTLLAALVSRLKGPQRAEALLLLGRHLQQVLVARRSAGASGTALRRLRDGADRAFAEAYEVDATPAICEAAADFCLLTQRRSDVVTWLRRALRVQTHKLDEHAIRERLIRVLLSMRPLPEDVEQEIADYDARFQGYEEVSLFWGMLQAARGELDKAVEQHTRYLERLLGTGRSARTTPGRLAEGYFLRGALYLRLASVRPDQSDEFLRLAIKDLRHAKTHAGGTVGASRYAIALSQALERAGKVDSALRELRREFEAGAGDSATAAMAARELVKMLGRQEKWAEQETIIRRQMQRRPKAWLWPYLLGRAAERRKARAEAERAYRQAAALCNYGADGIGREAVVRLLKLMVIRRAHQEMISLVKKHTRPADRGYRVWTYYGVALARTNRTDDALSAWSAACDTVLTTKEHAMISLVMQTVLGKDKALQAARRMARATGGGARVRFLLAVMLDQIGRCDEAIKTLEQARPATTQPAERAYLLTYLGILKTFKRQGKEAAALFQAALEIDKDNMTALNNLAFVLAEQLGQPKEALVYARRAAERMPDDANVLDTLGWCLALTGDYPAAVGVLEEAYSKRRAPLLCYHLAETYRRMEKLDSARRVAQEGLDLIKQSNDTTYHAKLRALLDQTKPGK